MGLRGINTATITMFRNKAERVERWNGQLVSGWYLNVAIFPDGQRATLSRGAGSQGFDEVPVTFNCLPSGEATLTVLGRTLRLQVGEERVDVSTRNGLRDVQQMVVLNPQDLPTVAMLEAAARRKPAKTTTPPVVNYQTQAQEEQVTANTTSEGESDY